MRTIDQRPLFFLKTLADYKFWALINPQIVIDCEHSREFGLLELEGGMMPGDVMGTKGHCVHVRPSIEIGGDRSYDYSLEIGYKIVW